MYKSQFKKSSYKEASGRNWDDLIKEPEMQEGSLIILTVNSPTIEMTIEDAILDIVDKNSILVRDRNKNFEFLFYKSNFKVFYNNSLGFKLDMKDRTEILIRPLKR